MSIYANDRDMSLRANSFVRLEVTSVTDTVDELDVTVILELV